MTGPTFPLAIRRHQLARPNRERRERQRLRLYYFCGTLHLHVRSKSSDYRSVRKGFSGVVTIGAGKHYHTLPLVLAVVTGIDSVPSLPDNSVKIASRYFLRFCSKEQASFVG